MKSNLRSFSQFGLLDPCAKTIPEGKQCVGNIIAVNASFTDVFMVCLFVTELVLPPHINMTTVR